MDRLSRRIGMSGACLALLLLMLTVPLLANEPPTAAQVAQYKADGTWAQRVANAYALGNHKAAPGLAANARWRVEQLARAALGLPPLRTPPPAAQGGLPSSGSPKVLVLLVDFPDYPHYANQTAADVYDKFFQDGNGDYPYESIYNYFERASYNTLHIQGNVLGWYTAQHNRSYYEALGNGPGQEAVMMEALDYFNAQGHDFTQYDNDGNGTIDSFYCKWTGPDTGWSGFWWAYKWNWHSNPSYTIDGKHLDTYVWSWIANPEGGDFDVHTDIHETGHALGLPDYYDYDDTVGPGGGLGGLDMQDDNKGDWNCFSKFMVGWVTPTTIVTGAQTLNLGPSGTSSDCVLIMPGVVAGNVFDEYFMVQYRNGSVGNDDTAGYPTGYAIWHVDATLDSYGWDFLYDNSYTAHKLLRRMEADGLEEIETGNGRADAGDFYLPPVAFGPVTFPNSDDYTPAATGIVVSQLTEPGATMGARFGFWGANAADAVLVAEGCSPANGAIDPGETVTVSLSLTNVGGASTGNLVATLLATGGVTSPTGPQSYGAIPSGDTATQSFSFVADGTCGGALTATLQLQDGANDYGAVSYTFMLGALAYTENFDGVTVPALPTGWTATLAQGPGPLWTTVNTAAQSGSNSAFAPSPAAVSDNRLDSPPIAITAEGAQLDFWHQWQFTDSWDAGVLEIAVDGGTFADILTAGGTFVTGGYTRQMTNTTSNPLTQRWAWADSSSGFVETIVNLPAGLTGHSIVLRWRLGSNASVATAGWWIDTYRILGEYSCCENQVVPGDMNCDGVVNNQDIDGFVLALFDAAGYATQYPDCDILRGDFTGDHVVNNQDIDGFIAVLFG